MFSWNWKKLWILLLVMPILTACPPHPQVSLPSQAVQGESVTASLNGLNGEGARVTVAGLEAKVTTATRDSITFVIPDAAPEGSQEVVIVSGDQRVTGKITIVAQKPPEPTDQTFVLDRKRAARGEVVNATTTGVDVASAKVTIGSKAVAIEPSKDGFSFKVPNDAPAGPQVVVLETDKGKLEKPLGVLGDVVADRLTILLKPDITEAQLQAVLEKLGFSLDRTLPDPFRELGESGVCGSTLADINVNGRPLGQALEELERESIALHIDPRSSWARTSVDHLTATSASIAHRNLYTGAGSLIAVLDTGVSPHDELTGRLILPFNAITGRDTVADVEDKFNDPNQPGTNEGHGTPIAVLAAGSTSGVAPEAQIMPVKTCNDEGICFSNDVIVGVCYALTAAEKNGNKSLILNLSFGGDTPVDALQAILDYALKQGVQVAAAAGNDGLKGSPKHYPAAFELDGLVAVGALEASSLQCVDFEQQIISDTLYVIGSTLTDRNVRMSFKAFGFGNGEFTSTGFATIDGDTNKRISTNNINVEFGFDYPLEALSFLYVDQGGSENLEVNGDLRTVGDLDSLDGQTVGDVEVSVNILADIPNIVALVQLQGNIRQFAVGGQEFFLDNVCPAKASAWQPAVFSTRGDYVDISAPGAGLRSGTPGGVYADAYEGTSFSTPLVAGAMALWKEADANLSPQQIEANLKRDALPLPPFRPSEVGAGLLNLNVAPFNVPLLKLTAGTQ